MDGRRGSSGLPNDSVYRGAGSEALIDELLALAGDAAHASERIAAPIACYLVGRAGIDIATARQLAAEVV